MKKIKTIKTILLILIYTVLILNSISQAQQDTPTSVQAKNIIYAEIAWVIYTGALSVNYERILHQHFSVRVGFGAGYMIGDAGMGPLAMVNFFTRGSDQKFEIGAGATWISRDFGDQEWQLWPAIALAYRFQQPKSGFFLRAGLTWTYKFGFPIQVSVGFTF